MQIKKEAIVLNDIEKVFKIVNQVDLYKNFVPYCTESEVFFHKNNIMEARLDFNLKGLSTAFTTRNKIKENEFIEMELVDGPFKYLDGIWEFKKVNDKTAIFLTINYETKNKIVEYTIAKSLEKITDYLVKAFVKEAIKK